MPEPVTKTELAAVPDDEKARFLLERAQSVLNAHRATCASFKSGRRCCMCEETERLVADIRKGPPNA